MFDADPDTWTTNGSDTGQTFNDPQVRLYTNNPSGPALGDDFSDQCTINGLR
jgi:hypothetical protein